SGNIVEKLRGEVQGNWRQFLSDGRVRRVITSGSALQKVPDNSVFSEALVAILRGTIQIGGEKDELFTGQQLSTALKKAVITKHGDSQTPQLGTMPLFGETEGDIVFDRVVRR